MFLHWAVLALLLLLPRAINGEKNVEERKIGVHRGGNCYTAVEYTCAERKCTMLCFAFYFCESFKPADTRLLLTAAILLHVDKEGRILERYHNNIAAQWMREFMKGHPSGKGSATGYAFEMNFFGDLKEAKAKMRNVTDMIIYIGSDYAHSYEAPPAGSYDPAYLQLQNIGDLKGDLYTNSVFRICSASEMTSSDLFTISKSDDPSTWISSPGIYRYRIPSGKMNELYYDPSRDSVTHLT